LEQRRLAAADGAAFFDTAAFFDAAGCCAAYGGETPPHPGECPWSRGLATGCGTGYTLRFSARELLGEQAAPRDSICVDFV
jgi:hypothetical protein